MNPSGSDMKSLFAQLGLADDDEAIAAFICEHRPLPLTVRLPDAPFWTEAQAALISEKLIADDDWALVVDTLNVQLREHPAPEQMKPPVEAPEHPGPG